jgi:branched-chain amino acid transport system ATP-binding protein
MLEVNHLSVSYGDAKALEDVTFRVSEGEFITLVGANGAGKTTTLRAITGSVRARHGQIRFNGHSLTDLPASRRAELGISLVPEGRELWPMMTVLENLELGAYCKLARKEKGKTLQWVYSLFPRLKERTSQLAGSLSGGEQQMVAIGRALMSRPRLLMLDEPSLGLAPIIVTELFKTIRELHHSGLTVLLVEQNLVKALEMAQRGYVLEAGRVRLSGTTSDLLRSSEIRAAYLGM